MTDKTRNLILVIVAFVSLAILLRGTGRSDIISGAGDTLSFSYPYSYTANYRGEFTASPGINIGAYYFNFGNPTFICDEEIPANILPLRWKKGVKSQYSDCWNVMNIYDGINQSLGISESTKIISPYLDITYQPQQFTYRYQEKTDEGITTKYWYVDDSSINYVFTVKQASKVISVKAHAPSKVTLGEEIDIIVNIRNELCGGSGGVIIDDNAVILNQWYINRQVSFDYDGCSQSITFTLPADKIGRHDMTISAYILLPEVIGGAIESKSKTTLSYEVVNEVIQGTSTPTSTNLFITLSEREESTEKIQDEAEITSVLSPEQRDPITSIRSPPNIRTLALVLLIGSAAGILIINFGRKKR